MVDVGFYLLGHNRTLNKVDNLGISEKQNCYIFKDRGGTEYLIPIESVEYIIPHEEECVECVEENRPSWDVTVKLKDTDNPLTNAEKFKEVFGFEVNRDVVADICSVIKCDGINDCDDCPYHDRYEWDDPYVKAEVKDE